MKKTIILLAVVPLVFTACKKDRVCNCKEVYNVKTPTVSEDVITEYAITMKDVSYMTAMKACVHSKVVDVEDTTTYTTDTNCSLE